MLMSQCTRLECPHREQRAHPQSVMGDPSYESMNPSEIQGVQTIRNFPNNSCCIVVNANEEELNIQQLKIHAPNASEAVV